MQHSINKKFLNKIRGFSACVLATASICSSAATISVVTDSSWLATNAAPSATWNTAPAFDTSTWINANVVVPTCLPGIDCIWYDGQFSATGNAWLRKTFSLTDPVVSAFLTGGVDDDADIFINGIQVLNDHNGTAGNFGPLDVTSLLVSGVNLIAVNAIDNIPVFGQNHAFAALLSIDTKSNTVPLPGVLSLFLIGLGGLAVTRRSRRPVHGQASLESIQNPK